MNNLNTVLVEGTLTRDPESKTLTAGVIYCRMAIANNRYYCDSKGEWQQDTSYFHIYVYGSVAESCIRRLKKGRGIRVVGRLKQRVWLDNGIRREVVYIIAEHIEFQPERKSIKEEVPSPERLPGELNTTLQSPPHEELNVDAEAADIDDAQQQSEGVPEF